MPFGQKRDHTKARLIVGIILATTLAAVFISWGLWQSAEYDREANDQAGKYAAYTDQKIRQSCLRVTPTYKQGCAAKVRHEQRDYERNERDLVAQRQSALWAYITGASAVIGMGLSVIGIFLVWTTFAETRKANAIANDALDGQLRPWIEFSINLKSVRLEDATLRPLVYVELSHHGASPALDYMIAARWFTDEFWHSERIYNFMPTMFDDVEVQNLRRTVFPGEQWKEFIKVEGPVGDLPCPATLFIAVQYKSPYSSQRRYTCKIFDLMHRDSGDRLFHGYPRSDLGLIALKSRNDRGDYAN